MLLKIRDIATGWVAALIVGVLVIPFAFFGIDYYFNQGPEPYVAKVNDTEIKQTQFQRALANYHQQMQKMLGTSVDVDDPFIKQQTLDSLIDSEVLNQSTLGSRLRVSKEKVVKTIHSIEMFHDTEGFDASLYQRSIVSVGMDPAVFEQQVMLDMLSEQIQAAIAESSFTTDKEIERIVRIKKQSRDFSYVLVPVKTISETIYVNDDEVNEFYEQNKSQYRTPLQLKIQYIDLTLDKVAEQVIIENDELENHFSNNKLAYGDPEKRKHWQIKVGKPKEATEEQLAEARIKADELLEVSKTIESFETLAETYSSTSETSIKVDVSESGFAERGKNPAEIDDVLFNMNIDDTNDVIETADAFYIIHLLDIEAAREKDFEEVKQEVEIDLRQEKGQKRFFDLADQLAALSYEHPDTLEVASDAIDISVEETGFFTQQGELDGNLNILSNPKILGVSFSQDVKEAGNNSEIIEISNNQVVVLRVVEEIEESQKPIEQVRDEIITAITNTKAKIKANDIGQSLLQTSQDSGDIAAILSQHSLEQKQVSAITRDDITVSRSVLRSAFRIEKTDPDTPAVEGSQLGNGDYALVMLDKINYPEKIMGIDLKNQQIEMQRIRADADWDGYFNALKDSADISIIESNL